ncbi:hypothetical protein L0152_17280 [bacterium]|nr:hypothetical protein [bacterium]
MIDKISDVKIRETVMEETTQAQEPQAQDNVAAEVEPLVQATPEYKSGLVAEQRLGGQAQEMLLANQLNSQIPVQNDVRTPTFTRDTAPPTTKKSVPEIVGDTLKQVPDQLGRTLGGIADAWSDPGAVISDAAAEARRKWDDIKAGK